MSRTNREGYNNYMRQYMLARYHKKRKEAIEFLGGMCAFCGSTENLEIDHINPADKKFGIAKLWSINAETFWEEIAKCQLLCKLCHLNKTKVDIRVLRTGFAEPQHGTYLSYRKNGCRCEPCIEAHSEKNRQYKEKSRGPSTRRHIKNPACGDTRRYRRGCRCDACRKANTDYNRQLRNANAIPKGV